ncbi:hypothetical protein JCM10213v2_006757 [Rhodosporidiobolus nylandii]
MSTPATIHSLPPELLTKVELVEAEVYSHFTLPVDDAKAMRDFHVSNFYERAACVIVAKSKNLEALFLDHHLEFLDDLKAFASALKLSTTGVFYKNQYGSADDRYLEHRNLSPPSFRLRRLDITVTTFGKHFNWFASSSSTTLTVLSIRVSSQKTDGVPDLLPFRNLASLHLTISCGMRRFSHASMSRTDLSSLSLGSSVLTLGDVGTLLDEGRLAQLERVNFTDYERETEEEKEALEASATSRGIEVQWEETKWGLLLLFS